MPVRSHPHLFVCHLAWTGAGRGETTSYGAFDRSWRVDLEGKPSLTGSAAPAFRGDPGEYNPEDLLMAALCSCHCLSYLTFCARAQISVLSYEDDATGRLELIEGRMRFSEVLLRPRVRIASGGDPELARALHAKAHDGCFIASSVNFPVRHEAVIEVG